MGADNNLTATQVGINATAFKTKVLDGINSTADSAHQQMLEKQAKYEAAKSQFSIFTAAKNKAFAKYNSIKQKSKSENDYNLKSAKSEYNATLSSYNDSEITTDVLRYSLQSAISYSGKMNNSAALAASIMG